jgi:lipopolysaccharide assembly outer membrane protein LptD (OstA)
MVDPDGRWTFEATGRRMEAAGISGPYDIEAAECRYEEADAPAVLMSAERGHLDQDKSLLTLEGNVLIRSGALRLEGERIEYDLHTGEVVADVPTKLSLGDGVAPEAPGQTDEERTP